MRGERTKVFLLLFSGLAFVFNCYASAETHPISDHPVYDLSNRLTTLSLVLGRKANDTFMTLNEQTNHKYQDSFYYKKYRRYKEIRERTNPLFPDKGTQHANRNMVSQVNNLNSQSYRREASVPLNLRFNLRNTEKGKSRSQRLFNKHFVKRNAVYRNDNTRQGISREKQKKAKALGRLLINNISNKNDEEMQDDYVEDEDDDYFKGVNKKIMNWEDYQNEDGASVMELIALNTRHKTTANPTHDNEYLYR